MSEAFLISAKPDLQQARVEWLKRLEGERRLSALTVTAYERDTRQFLQFLTGHLGDAPGIKDIADLRPSDFRAFLAMRRLRRCWCPQPGAWPGRHSFIPEIS